MFLQKNAKDAKVFTGEAQRTQSSIFWRMAGLWIGHRCIESPGIVWIALCACPPSGEWGFEPRKDANEREK